MRITPSVRRIAAALVLVLASTVAVRALAGASARWSAEERAILRSLSYSSMPPVPADPSNKYADDERAAELGHKLFFDTKLSGNGRVACASCHIPSQDFQDAKPLGVGTGVANRRTMPIASTAHSPWQFWDGRADSQWGQALGPLESPVEHGGSRAQYAHVIAESYRDEYEAVFGALPNLRATPRQAGPVADTAWHNAWRRIPVAHRDEITHVYANIGKAIAAYERRIQFGESRFDRYIEAELAGQSHTSASAFTRDEEAGLKVFIGKGSCVNCHNGSLLTDNHFHNTGVRVADASLPPDSGRATGVRQAIEGEFSCTSKYSDAKADDCEELRFATTEGEELVRAYKTPSLRNVAERAPYMHAGQLSTLAEVIEHYDRAASAPAGHSELKRLRLSATERRQLEAFLRTLSAPLVAPPKYLAAPSR